MTLTGKSERDNGEKKRSKQQRQLRIARDKERARIWAVNRRLRRKPIVVAHKVTGLNTESTTEVPFSSQQSEANPQIIIKNLVERKHKLLREADEIQFAIQVIQRSFPHLDT